MGYINKEFLETQFKNFATRISTIFAKKTDLPTVNEGKLTLKQNGTTISADRPWRNGKPCRQQCYKAAHKERENVQ